MSGPRRRFAHVAVALSLTVVAACGTPEPERPAPTATPPPAGTPTPSEPEAPGVDAPIAVDLAPGGDAVPLDNGWTVQHCEGDAPFVCVRDGEGTLRGTVEYLAYPASEAMTEAVANGTVAAALEAMVEEQHAAIAADRAEGCGPTYDYRAEPVRLTTLRTGAPAAVYGFSGVVDGDEIERQRSYFTVHDGQVWILSAPASDPEGCMATDLDEFTPTDLTRFEPYLERIVAGSQLP